MCDCSNLSKNGLVILGPNKNKSHYPIKTPSNLPFQINVVSRDYKDDKYSLNSLNINDKFNTGEYLKLKERKKLHGSFYVPKENYYNKYDEPFNENCLENQDFKKYGYIESEIDFTLRNVFNF